MDVLAKHKIFKIECKINNYENLPEDTLGQRITKLRKKNRMTKKEFAIKTGLSQATIYNVETGKTIPNMSTIRKLCKSLSISPAKLFKIDTLPEETPDEIIKKYRLMNGLSQEDLAEKCDLNKSTIKDYENGKIKGNPETIKKIYKIIGYV
ncbi:helix-turn-helix domain-containing protein [Maledivibacter halophilus]|uniref:Predicted transcription factor, homolog of eukaryotic MBF1 n=1 Tax=Maledivibacter halophilus TaxID=36842 RepID=A0A1T5MQ94_9FIRM|nr:helix-turn-helix transcriptional regulator [Maledivibacter halophilus]SKC90395.1 Predicted transcription factor, homolog of eukaryotic MBF1 [Maledivibacter halophilus]